MAGNQTWQSMNTKTLLPITATTATTPTMAAGANSMVWFRKGLRVHDNPALSHAAAGAARLFPVFVLDPHYLAPDPAAFSPGSSRAGLNRIRFLLESLADLDSSLRGLGSRLLVFHGDPPEVVIRLLKEPPGTLKGVGGMDPKLGIHAITNGKIFNGRMPFLTPTLLLYPGLGPAMQKHWRSLILDSWKIGKLCFEADSEPYAQIRDKRVMDFASMSNIEVFSPVSHTLFDPAAVIRKNGGKPPLSYQSFIKLVGQPPNPIEETISFLPPVGSFENSGVLSIPTIKELGYGETKQEEFSPFKGGESEALKRLRESLADEDWVAKFEKPKGDPSAFLKPATTVLSPYLKFGCLSCRYFYQCLQDVYKKVKKHTLPPVSLFGQLLWREFFYTAAYGTPNFDCMDDNKICKQVPWSADEELFAAWREARTGYPWIDAIMVQLHKWGWMHHLARHCVACFLTRGDLFVHWEKGRDVFERLLVDHDWAINNGNWLWLSCSSFFYQYNRIYSPISFGKKYDPEGSFIRHFLPVLKEMPKEYIYEPWTAPLSVQSKAKCIIGKDYPNPVVDHNLASKNCKRKMGEAYELSRRKNGLVTKDDLRNLRRKLEAIDETPTVRNKKKQSTIKEFLSKENEGR